jgi:hypothetical protein
MTENEAAENRPTADITVDAHASSDHVHHCEHDGSVSHEHHSDYHHSHREEFEPRH